MDELSYALPGRKSKQGGFTLIELLVVVAIIALLIAILLPSLGRARENARIVVCGTHMKQIATANIMYIGDYNGNMITAGIAITGVPWPTGMTPHAQFWANDLASMGYLPSKNNIASSNGSTSIPSTNTIFYCPDGSLTENLIMSAGGNVSFTGYCPRSPINTWYVKLISATPLANDTAAFSWYALNCHNINASNRVGYPGGIGPGQGGATGFVQWHAAGLSGETIAAPGGYARKLVMVQQTQKFVMVVESSSISWDANGNITPTDNGGVFPTTGHPERLAGRHGDTLNKGYDGYTNFAYFDGHVAKQSTVPYSNNPVSTYTLASPDGTGNFLPPVVPDTIFYFQSQ